MEQKIQWLVRKRNLQKGTIEVLGPYWTDQVFFMLDKGLLTIEDELCKESSYWFSLHETEEFKKFLNPTEAQLKRIVNSSVPEGADQEVTLPDIQLENVESTVFLKSPKPTAAPGPTTSKRTAQAAAASFPPQGVAQEQHRRRIEKAQILSFLFFAGMISVLLAVALVIRTLRS